MTTSRAPLSPVYLVCGPEAFLRREAVTQLVAAALQGQEDAFGRACFDGERASLADVLDEVRTPSLLGDRRVVVVEDADDFISEHRKPLEKYVGAPSESGCLILACGSEAGTTKLFKAINARGGVVPCRLPDRPWDRAKWIDQWIIHRAASVYDKRLDRQLESKLRDLVGESLGLLDQELSKLSTYVGPRTTITAEDVEALVGNHREQAVFAITDAMAAGDVARALRHWERVLATDRAAPHRAIGGLAWGIRRRLEPAPDPRLEDQLCDLLDADVGSKSGLASVDRAVERFIVKHTVAAKRVAAGG